jgi:hypothetical protein
MSRYAFQGTFRDGQGNIVSSGQVIVYPAGTTTAATIYADDTTVDVSPYVESDSNGYFIFYVDDGDYNAGQAFDIQLSKTGYTTKIYPDIVVFSAVDWIPDKSESATDFLDGTGVWDTIKESDLVLTDITTNNASTTKHGFLKKLDDDDTHFLDGKGSWDTIKESEIVFTDNTTNDVSTAKHGFVPKLPNASNQFFNGVGGWAVSPAVPTGASIIWFLETPPVGFLECDGASLDNTDYLSLLSVIGVSFGRGTPISCVCESDDFTITDIGHGRENGDVVYFTASSMPTGLDSDTIYYVINSTDNTFKVSSTSGGEAVEFSTDGTTVVYYTEFVIPDMRGYFPRGWSHGETVDPDAATRTDRGDGTDGDHVGTKQAGGNVSHTHTGTTSSPGSHAHNIALYTLYGAGTSGLVGTGTAGYGGGTGATAVGGDHNHTFTSDATGGNESRPININVMFCIKY